jgi:transposase
VPGADRCAKHKPSSAIGRPSKFTPEAAARIIQAAQAGVYPAVAAAFAGISTSTLDGWLRDAAEDIDAGRETPLSVFSEEIGRVVARIEVAALARIQAAMADDWRAAAWFIERRFPERWSKRDARHLERSGQASTAVVELLGGRQPVQVPLETREKIAAMLDEGAPSDGTA